MTPDDLDTFPGARDDTYGRQGPEPKPRRLAWWRRVLLWLIPRVIPDDIDKRLGGG